MATPRRFRRPDSKTSHHTRRPRRLSPLARAIERAEDRFDRRQELRRLNDASNYPSIPLDQVKQHFGL